MDTKVTKTTSKGQITLPSKWRNKFKTSNFVMEIEANQITIKPASVEEIGCEEVIFDADQDNDGKGISADEMIKMLTKLNNG